MFILGKDRQSGRCEGPVEKKPEKDRKKRESMSAQIRSSRIVDCDRVMPPSLPMVF